MPNIALIFLRSALHTPSVSSVSHHIFWRSYGFTFASHVRDFSGSPDKASSPTISLQLTLYSVARDSTLRTSQTGLKRNKPDETEFGKQSHQHGTQLEPLAYRVQTRAHCW
ncbi:hypothetical protein KSP40_PGU005078 [Platanthera guangdongensis]|uniref:Secreted protein n=1 Tax=Platanthera guangdongensis TaxID=2320717 RepID=A0ABR2M3U5_9ASPA